MAFIYALQNTTVANVTVLYATLPFMTAILAWLWFREKAGEAHPDRQPGGRGRCVGHRHRLHRHSAAAISSAISRPCT